MTLNDAISAAAKELRISVPRERTALPPGLDSLKGKRILLVDDGPDVFMAFLAPLMMATEGSAQFLLQRSETKEQLADAIIGKDPAIVLLDEYLQGCHGHELLEPLRSKNPRLRCIGFSSAPSAESAFRERGAEFVLKDAADAQGTVRRLAEILS